MLIVSLVGVNLTSTHSLSPVASVTGNPLVFVTQPEVLIIEYGFRAPVVAKSILLTVNETSLTLYRLNICVTDP